MKVYLTVMYSCPCLLLSKFMMRYPSMYSFVFSILATEILFLAAFFRLRRLNNFKNLLDFDIL